MSDDKLLTGEQLVVSDNGEGPLYEFLNKDGKYIYLGKLNRKEKSTNSMGQQSGSYNVYNFDKMSEAQIATQSGHNITSMENEKMFREVKQSNGGKRRKIRRVRKSSQKSIVSICNRRGQMFSVPDSNQMKTRFVSFDRGSD